MNTYVYICIHMYIYEYICIHMYTLDNYKIDEFSCTSLVNTLMQTESDAQAAARFSFVWMHLPVCFLI